MDMVTISAQSNIGAGEAIDVMGIIVNVVKMVLSVGASGPAGWIASGVVLLLAIGGGLYIKGLISKNMNEAAGKESDRQKSDLESGVVKDNSKMNKDINDSEDYLRKL